MNEFSTGAEVCRHFLRGRCRYGDRCRNLHDKAVVNNSDSAQDTNYNHATHPNPRLYVPQASVSTIPTEPCRRWLAGLCKRGSRCWYSHDVVHPFSPALTMTTELEEERRAAEEAAEAAAEVITRELEFMIEGERERRRQAIKKQTRKAEALLRRQVEAEERERAWRAEMEARRREEEARQLQEAAAAQLAEQELARHDAQITTQHVVLGSTLISCGSGLEVRDIVTGFEACRVTIKNLPSDAQPNEVVELFTQQGMSRDQVHVVSIYPMSGRRGAARRKAGSSGEEIRLEAKVLTRAVEGAIIAAGLDGIEFRDESLTFEVNNVASAHSMGECASKQADTLTITCLAPSDSIIATFDTMEEARLKARGLNGRTIPGGGGREIRAEMYQPPPEWSYSPESVKLTRIPTNLTYDALCEFIGTHRFRFIRSNTYDLESLLDELHEHLTNVQGSPLREFIVSHEQNAIGVIMIKAHFDSWGHAHRVYEYIQERTSDIMYFGPSLRFFLPKPHHFIMTIPVQQYEAQVTRWDELSDSSDPSQEGAPHLAVSHVQKRGIIRLRLSGGDKKTAGALKVRVETLAAGEKLDATFWHRSFLRREGKEFLNQVFEETGVYARADFKSQALKIYGVGEAKQRARQMIKDEIAWLEQGEYIEVLERRSVGFFVREGLDALRELWGEDAITFDPIGRTITLRGGEEAAHMLTTLVKLSLDNVYARVSKPGNDAICPICNDAASNAVTLACKHSYCRACMRHYLISASETKIFPLTCIGDESSCNRPIPIPIIQQFLTPQQYEHLVAVVFSTYLDQHPQEFKFCTTTDCPQIYRADTRTMLKCPSCYAEVCSHCQEEAHEGMTCQERRMRKADEEQLDGNWATSVGMKRCPSCKAYIEKNGGCNHMRCHCGAHICWICTEEFPNNERTYEHLREIHGGIYDNDHHDNNNDARIAAELQQQENARDARHPRRR